MIGSFAALLVAPAEADVVAMPPDGEQYITHSVRVEGLAAHPGFVLMAYDRSASLSDWRAWPAGSKAEQVLSSSGSARGPTMSGPSFRLLTADAYAAWRAKTDALVAEQRSACARGEGCAHPSRFVPRVAPPADALDCSLAISPVTVGPAGGPDTVVQVVELVEASATRCVVRERTREYLREGQAVTAPKAGGCDTAGGAASVVTGLAVALLGVRRRTRGA